MVRRWYWYQWTGLGFETAKNWQRSPKGLPKLTENFLPLARLPA